MGRPLGRTGHFIITSMLKFISDLIKPLTDNTRLLSLCHMTRRARDVCELHGSSAVTLSECSVCCLSPASLNVLQQVNVHIPHTGSLQSPAETTPGWRLLSIATCINSEEINSRSPHYEAEPCVRARRGYRCSQISGDGGEI